MTEFTMGFLYGIALWVLADVLVIGVLLMAGWDPASVSLKRLKANRIRAILIKAARRGKPDKRWPEEP